MERVSNNNNFDKNEFVLKVNEPRLKDKNLYYKGDNLFTFYINSAIKYTMEEATKEQDNIKRQLALDTQIIKYENTND